MPPSIHTYLPATLISLTPPRSPYPCPQVSLTAFVVDLIGAWLETATCTCIVALQV